MCFRRPVVPLDVQFEAACAAASVNDMPRVKDILAPYGFRVGMLFQERWLRSCFTFSASQLLDYFKRHPAKCRELFDDCGDKRYSPSTFVQQIVGTKLYQVGMFDKHETGVRVFGSLEEAITDYVLFSLRLGRLDGSITPEQVRAMKHARKRKR